LHGGLRRSPKDPRLTLTRNGLVAGKGGSAGAPDATNHWPQCTVGL
jgi:hypothetical protein